MKELLDTYRTAITRVGWSKTARLAGVDRVTLHRHYGATGGRQRCPRLDELIAVGKIVGLEVNITEKMR